MMLRIGACDSQSGLLYASFTRNELARIGVESELAFVRTQQHPLQHEGSAQAKHSAPHINALEEALWGGEIDVAVHALRDVSVEQREGLVITAVSQRTDPAEWLLIPREMTAQQSVLRLRPDAVAGTFNLRQTSQLLDIRPDICVQALRGEVPVCIENLRRGVYDAIVLSATEVIEWETDLGEFDVVRFDPGEFVPAPAQGVLAWQTLRDDTATRLLLREIHHPEVSALTNVERRALQLLGSDLQMSAGIHCRQDAQGHYHAFAVCQTGEILRRARLSSSTSAGLAESLVRALEV